MGKANRIRNNRYSSAYAAVKTPKKKDGMPAWAINLIAILVTAAILFTAVLIMMVNNGVFGRMSTAMKSENFRVNRNMMNYYFQTQYQNLMSNNQYGIDTNRSLKDQYLSTDENGNPTFTWYDYIMDSTEAQVEEILIFCEEAKARGIELDEHDLHTIEEDLDSFDSMQASYDYIGDVYGKGMKEKDLRAAKKLQSLAQKCANVIGEELDGQITDEDIVSRYDTDPKLYHSVDYYNYKDTVEFEDAVIAILGEDHEHEDIEKEENKAKIIEEYKKMIAAAKEKAEALSKLESPEEFKKQTVKYVVLDAWKDKYTAPELEAADLPSEETLEKIKEIAVDYIVKCIIDKSNDILKFVVEEAVEGATDGAKIYVIEGIGEISKSYAEFITKTVSTIHTTASNTTGTMTVEGASYAEDDDVIAWAFLANVNTGKTFEKGDGADGVEISNDPHALKSFSVTVAYVNKAAYRDEEITKNVGLMIFHDLDEALAAIGGVHAGITLGDLEALCENNHGEFTDYKNYFKGALGNDEFDSWLYDEATVIGSVTTEIIPINNGSNYLAALYYGDGLPKWKVVVKADIFEDRYTEAQTAITTKFQGTIVKNEKSINKIDA